MIGTLEAEDPDLLAQIAAYAENYTPVDRDDIREDPPIDRVVVKLAHALRGELDVQVPQEHPPSPALPDDSDQWQAFHQLLDLFLRQAIQKENEHYFLPRGHHAMRKNLLDLAGGLVERGLLEHVDDVFELSPEMLMSAIDKAA